jgi:hypothetical protein
METIDMAQQGFEAEEGSETIATAKDAAREVADAARDVAKTRAQGFFEAGRSAATARLDGVSEALRAASERSQGQPGIADFARRTADRVENVARSLRERDLDEVIEAAESFARRDTAAFLAGSFVAGFALARFLKASSQRRSTQSTRSYLQGPDAPEPMAGPHTSAEPYGPM